MCQHRGDNVMKLVIALFLALAPASRPSAPAAAAEEPRYVVKPIAEMKIKQLPPGPLYWRVENFPTLEEARAAAGRYRWNPDTVGYEGSPALAAEVAGKVWLFTLGAKGGATPGASKVVESGPVPQGSAPEDLVGGNHGYGPAGAAQPGQH